MPEKLVQSQLLYDDSEWVRFRLALPKDEFDKVKEASGEARRMQAWIRTAIRRRIDSGK